MLTVFKKSSHQFDTYSEDGMKSSQCRSPLAYALTTDQCDQQYATIVWTCRLLEWDLSQVSRYTLLNGRAHYIWVMQEEQEKGQVGNETNSTVLKRYVRLHWGLLSESVLALKTLHRFGSEQQAKGQLHSTQTFTTQAKVRKSSSNWSFLVWALSIFTVYLSLKPLWRKLSCFAAVDRHNLRSIFGQRQPFTGPWRITGKWKGRRRRLEEE